MKSRAGYTHVTVSLGLSKLELNITALVRSPTVTLETESDKSGIGLTVSTKVVECTAKLSQPKIPSWLATIARCDTKLGTGSISLTPRWEIKPTMKVLSEIEAASKVKYGTPQVSLMACRYNMVKGVSAKKKQEMQATQGSLF